MEVLVPRSEEAALVEEVLDVSGADGGRRGDGQQEVSVARQHADVEAQEGFPDLQLKLHLPSLEREVEVDGGVVHLCRKLDGHALVLRALVVERLQVRTQLLGRALRQQLRGYGDAALLEAESDGARVEVDGADVDRRVVQVEEARVEADDEGQRCGQVVSHSDGTERNVRALPNEREDDLHDGLGDAGQE